MIKFIDEFRCEDLITHCNQFKIKEFIEKSIDEIFLAEDIIIFPDAMLKEWGFPSGLRLITKENQVIFPTAVSDLGCGYRVIKTNLNKNQVSKFNKKKIMDRIIYYSDQKSKIRVEIVENLDIDKIFSEGISYMIKLGYGDIADLKKIRDWCVLEIDEELQLFTEYAKKDFGVYSGDFFEIRYASNIDSKFLNNYSDCKEGDLFIIIHSGAMSARDEFIEHVYTPMIQHLFKIDFDPIKIEDGTFYIDSTSNEGKKYLKIARYLVQYATASRQLTQHLVSKALKSIFGEEVVCTLVSDVCHSIIEKDESGNISHSRGLQKVYPAYHELVLDAYRETGDIVLLAGQRGTSSNLVIPNKNIELYGYLLNHGTPFPYSCPLQYKIKDEEIEIVSKVFFNKPYDIIDEFRRESWSYEETCKLLFSKIALASPCVELKPYINYNFD